MIYELLGWILAPLQSLMQEAPSVDNVIDACHVTGRQECLDGLLEQLEMCEKALQVRISCILLGNLTASVAGCRSEKQPGHRDRSCCGLELCLAARDWGPFSLWA
jgi:hypothetical protein